jgi:hypothetical protein
VREMEGERGERKRGREGREMEGERGERKRGREGREKESGREIVGGK